MNIINFLVRDVVKFAADRNLDLIFILKLIDYLLCVIEVNIEDDQEVATYINNARTVNTLIMLMGVATNYTDQERKAYDNDTVVSMLDNPSRLEGYKKYKLSIYTKYHAEQVELYEQYRQEVL